MTPKWEEMVRQSSYTYMLETWDMIKLIDKDILFELDPKEIKKLDDYKKLYEKAYPRYHAQRINYWNSFDK